MTTVGTRKPQSREVGEAAGGMRVAGSWQKAVMRELCEITSSKRIYAADELRANSKLKSSEYSVPVLGLIFLR